MIEDQRPGRGEGDLSDDRLKVKAEIEKRTTRYVPIPDDFDPLNASQGDLARYRLPPKPDERDETLFTLWKAALKRPVDFVAPALGFGSPIALYQLNAFPFSADNGEGEAERGAPSLQLGRTRVGHSRNWSGGVILSRRGNRSIQMAADWRVPNVLVGDGPGPFVCSTWIGIGGYRAWMTSMPQMGTAQSVGDTGGKDDSGNPLPPNFAWCQWWLRGMKTLQFPITIDSVPVAAEHEVICWITLLPPNHLHIGDRDWVLFYIRNLDTNTATSIAMAPPTDNLGRSVPAQAASAEWMLERPTAVEDSPNGNIHNGDLYPLPQFGEASVDSFATTLAPEPVLAPPVPATGFRACRRVRMIDRVRSDGSVTVLVDARKVNDSSLEVNQK